MNAWQKWVVGISIILASVCGYVAATLDGDPSTNGSIADVASDVKRGVDVLRVPAAPAPATVPAAQ